MTMQFHVEPVRGWREASRGQTSLIHPDTHDDVMVCVAGVRLVRSLMAQLSGQINPDMQPGGSRAYVWTYDNLSEDSDPSNPAAGDDADAGGLVPASEPASRPSTRHRH